MALVESLQKAIVLLRCFININGKWLWSIILQFNVSIIRISVVIRIIIIPIIIMWIPVVIHWIMPLMVIG
jgi:hypothetical protein